MFQRRCTLCNGKLDGNHICTECGLDNKVAERNYRVNQSSCDHQPLTHVHEESKKAKKTSAEKPKKNQTAPVRTAPKQTISRPKSQSSPERMVVRSKSPGRLLGRLVLILMIFGIGASAVRAIVEEFGNSGYSDVSYEDIDPYEYIEEQLSESGDTVEYTLTSGFYEVGVHIPEGQYTAEVSSEYDTVQVDDGEHGIYLYEYEAKEFGNHLDDLRLFTGARVTISAESEVILRTENGQTEAMSGQENPLHDTVTLADEEAKTAGDDFAAGVYDIRVTEGYGSVYLKIYDTDGTLYTEKSLYLGEGTSDGTEYKNLVLPDDAEISCSPKLKIQMEPSPVIGSSEYLSYYLY